MMKYYELDSDEQEIHDAAERDELIPVADAEHIKETITAAAKAAGNKTRNINIRLSERTLLKLKAKAAEEGIPYQTLISSILHKYS